MAINSWPDDLLAKAKELYESGKYSASQVIKYLDTDKTRNALIGIAHRHKWINPNPRHGGRKLGEKAPRRPSYAFQRRIAIPGPENPETAPEAIAMADNDIPMEQRKSFAELGDNDCRFGIGEVGHEGFFFCGAPILEDQPYCVHHCDRAFMPRKLSTEKNKVVV